MNHSATLPGVSGAGTIFVLVFRCFGQKCMVIFLNCLISLRWDSELLMPSLKCYVSALCVQVQELIPDNGKREELFESLRRYQS